MPRINITKRDLFLFLMVAIFVWVALPVVNAIAYQDDLLSKDRLMNRNNTGLILLDRNNKPFFKFYETRFRKTVPITEMSDYAQKAVIAAEDKEYYQHPGFSVRAIAGSIMADIKQKEFVYGGSTITQQLVKNSLLNSEKTLGRKYRELLLSQELEKRYSKDEILEMYLNSVYFGEGAFGIEDAAQTYFGVPAKNLDLAQASMLAGLLKAPSYLSPISGNPDASASRQKYVLDQMVDAGFISREQHQQAITETLTYSPSKNDFNYQAPHFALMVKQALIDQYGEDTVAQSGFKVHTTLDLDWQQKAENAVKKQVANLSSSNVTNGASIAIEPSTGEVRALVGSVDWRNPKFGQVNMVTTPRQPGSSFKPLVYAAALEKGVITPATVLQDKPTTFPGNYKPQNYDKKFRGQVLVRRALANSLNIPAVEVLQRIGVPAALEMANRMGITTLHDESRFGLSLVLGTGEVPLIQMASAYATFANNGVYNNPTLIRSIDDKFGNQIYAHKPESKQVMDPKIAFLISSMLSDPYTRRESFGSVLDNRQLAAVKTGTSEDYKDSWTIGYTPEIAIAVWVGNNDNQAMSQVAGSIGAAPIWKEELAQFSSPNYLAKFSQPQGVTKLSVCRFNGLPTREATSSAMTEYFLAGSEPKGTCSIPKPDQTPKPEQAAASTPPST